MRFHVNVGRIANRRDAVSRKMFFIKTEIKPADDRFAYFICFFTLKLRKSCVLRTVTYYPFYAKSRTEKLYRIHFFWVRAFYLPSNCLKFISVKLSVIKQLYDLFVICFLHSLKVTPFLFICAAQCGKNGKADCSCVSRPFLPAVNSFIFLPYNTS